MPKTGHVNDRNLFQPTLPVRGSERNSKIRFRSLSGFQPTLPVRASDVKIGLYCPCQFISTHAPRAGERPPEPDAPPARGHDFNPRSPCGERPMSSFAICSSLMISTHAPRAGERHGELSKENPCWVKFQTHAPRAGSDCSCGLHQTDALISTHAPRAGSDLHRRFGISASFNFNPRSPCGSERGLSL